MPNLVKPKETHCVKDRDTKISCLTTASQTSTNSQAMRQTTAVSVIFVCKWLYACQEYQQREFRGVVKSPRRGGGGGSDPWAPCRPTAQHTPCERGRGHEGVFHSGDGKATGGGHTAIAGSLVMTMPQRPVPSLTIPRSVFTSLCSACILLCPQPLKRKKTSTNTHTQRHAD